MGIADTIVVLDRALDMSCSAGHVLRSFQTKDLDKPSMATYLVDAGRLFLAVNDERTAECDETVGWRIEGEQAIRVHRYSLREVHPALTVRRLRQVRRRMRPGVVPLRPLNVSRRHRPGACRLR